MLTAIRCPLNAPTSPYAACLCGAGFQPACSPLRKRLQPARVALQKNRPVSRHQSVDPPAVILPSLARGHAMPGYEALEHQSPPRSGWKVRNLAIWFRGLFHHLSLPPARADAARPPDTWARNPPRRVFTHGCRACRPRRCTFSLSRIRRIADLKLSTAGLLCSTLSRRWIAVTWSSETPGHFPCRPECGRRLTRSIFTLCDHQILTCFEFNLTRTTIVSGNGGSWNTKSRG